METRVLFKKNHPDAKVPTRGHEGDAGYDVYAIEDTIIPTYRTVIVPAGISIQLPQGYYAELHPRSSLALRSIYMKIGIIDEGYRGDIGAIVIALHTPMEVKKGERIAQLILKKREAIEFKEVDTLSKSERGQQGFGSTGQK